MILDAASNGIRDKRTYRPIPLLGMALDDVLDLLEHPFGYPNDRPRPIV